MNDTFRYFLAAVLIFLIIILQPLYLEWLGYDPVDASSSNKASPNETLLVAEAKQGDISGSTESLKTYVDGSIRESYITISSPLYTATLTNRAGGSFVNYIINDNNSEELKYVGGYDDSGYFDPTLSVSLILPSTGACMPCLAAYNERVDEYDYFDKPFALLSSVGSDTLFLGPEDLLDLKYQLVDSKGDIIITKSVVFYGNSYVSDHSFSIDRGGIDISGDIEVVWSGGLRPTEESVEEDVQYSSGIISQAGEINDIQVGGVENSVDREAYKGQTEWVAVRTKYFMSALLLEIPGSYAVLSATNVPFGNRKQTPLYSAGIGLPREASFVSSKIYLGPLDVDHVSKVGSGLDKTMNWGFAIIRPISKGVLWILKFMHKTFNINYGVVLLIFAVLVRLISGPLTKKSFESSQNMQGIQPELKKVQSKYKGDPQRLNRETMALYKKHKVNPLGGCLPLLLQMPLLWALFMVFRTTIEFRGAPFVFWINDLSKPDVVFTLPFSIPVYGNGVAILPLLMGATLILTMRMTSVSMDKSQKPVMYFMNVFFVLLFNTFPSGLNLYYTAYNILSFFQQRSIRAKSGNK
jgi:YidC/Oxa1 family membrane protein insertase